MTIETGKTYEQAFEELEIMVSRLASGTLPLEETVQLYTHGRELAAYCQTLLDQAELQVSRIDDAGNASSLV